MNERLPRVGDLVKMKCDGEYGLVGVVHKVRSLTGHDQLGRERGEVYDITWPDVRSVQYLSEIVVVARKKGR
jgi:hypothetical protein